MWISYFFFLKGVFENSVSYCGIQYRLKRRARCKGKGGVGGAESTVAPTVNGFPESNRISLVDTSVSL
jgi:hypothetical protein